MSHPADDEAPTTGGPALPRQAHSGLFAGGDANPDAYELLGDGHPGGEGTTWRALDHGLAASTVCAVKMLSRPVTDGALRRLTEQRRLLQHLDLKHVVRVYDVLAGPPPHPRGGADPTATRTLYVIMEWVDGPTLRQLVAAEPVTAQTLLQRLGYVSQLAGALDGLATSGNAALHRDIKPGNCIIHERRGLILVDVTALRPALNGFDPAGGHTPGYAAPEVLAAPRHARTLAADMYSLGAVTAFCLTGTDDDDSPGRRSEQLLEVAAETGVPDPEAFVRHLMTALDPEPRRRPAKPLEWSERLIILATHPWSPRPAPAGRPRRRAPLVAVALGTVAVIGAGTAAATTLRGHDTQPPQTLTSPSAVVGTPSRTPAPPSPSPSPSTTTASPSHRPSNRPPPPSSPRPSRTSPGPTAAPVVASGSIGTPSSGASVQSCSYFSGTATVPPGKTLILTKRNLTTGNPDVYAELVHHWDEPERLNDWQGAQYFGQGDESSGQNYEVGLRVVPLSAVDDYHKARDYGKTLSRQGTELASVRVRRVAGERADGCPGL